MKTKVLVLLAALSFGAPVFISSDAYAHGGSKDGCYEDYYGNVSCKHTKFERKARNKVCHRHEAQASYGWEKINQTHLSTCSKT